MRYRFLTETFWFTWLSPKNLIGISNRGWSAEFGENSRRCKWCLSVFTLSYKWVIILLTRGISPINHSEIGLINQLSYPLVNVYSLLLKMAPFIVDLPVKVVMSFVSLPGGICLIHSIHSDWTWPQSDENLCNRQRKILEQILFVAQKLNPGSSQKSTQGGARQWCAFFDVQSHESYRYIPIKPTPS